MTPAYLSVAGHVTPDLLQIGARGRSLVDDSTFTHDQDAIGQGEHLVQIRADQEYGRARVSRLHDACANFRDRRKIQPKTRVCYDQESNLPVQLAGQYCALHVSSGQVSNSLVRCRRLDALLPD